MLRLAQSALANDTDGVCMASVVDLGDWYSPYGSVHSRAKEALAQRLFQCALALTYGVRSTPYRGPSLVDMTQLNATLYLHFDNVGAGLELHTSNTSNNERFCPLGDIQCDNCCAWFDVQLGIGGAFVAVTQPTLVALDTRARRAVWQPRRRCSVSLRRLAGCNGLQFVRLAVGTVCEAVNSPLKRRFPIAAQMRCRPDVPGSCQPLINVSYIALQQCFVLSDFMVQTGLLAAQVRCDFSFELNCMPTIDVSGLCTASTLSVVHVDEHLLHCCATAVSANT